MPQITLYSWLQRGLLTARQDQSPLRRWIVHADPGEIERLRQRHNLPRGYHQRRRWADNETMLEEKEP